MKQLILPTRRPFPTRAYLFLVALLVPAELAILPYVHSLPPGEDAGFWTLMLGAAIDLLLLAALAAAGLFLAGRVGLGMPFIEGWANRQPVWNRVAGVAGAALLAGILLPLILLLDSAVAPLLERASATPATATVVHPPAWQGFLAAFSAGITEETLFRLFGLTLVVWLGSLIFRSRTGRPAPGLLWVANILFAFAFALVHLRTASQLGITLHPLLVIRTLVINGAGGLLFGWLYISFGLESAILAHIAADVVVHGFVPLVTQQADPAQKIVATVVVLLITLLAMLWSIRAILRDRRQLQPADEPGEAEVEVGFSHPAG